MRDFFINALDKIVGVIVILGAIAVLIGTITTLFGQGGGILPALGLLIGGTLYLLVTGGMLYLFLGIYANTKRTAEALERR
ncbi:hypothetical protein [Jannaschia rubra]|uniref:Uncharacterized protein n=1 Tax=Jannaschia rubra TaxID=282197 RepID=A0A0M6XSD3_9RHOB|nr:hypothetical protein [Jannaschia rubra]CTQ33698.1 hypothetical protein JAN5088_02483 [Jannaschia rubra]SFG06842.1 hypothetical protein SAMN04488517_102531 [Jannaschia rubra]